ncbi:MAG: hypothetical protein Q4B43_06480 [Bacteroidota bacterium]|nr:hypothetical protein [Bacteroidota bacterium]
MLKRKVLLAVAMVGFAAVSCSDDNNKSTSISPLIGTWKAETLSYDVPGVHAGTYPFNHPMIKHGCDTDYLELKEGNISKLTENNKVIDAGDCENADFTGTWVNDKIFLNGKAERTILSIEGDTLKLTYPMQFGNFPEIDVVVKYSRK